VIAQQTVIAKQETPRGRDMAPNTVENRQVRAARAWTGQGGAGRIVLGQEGKT
jgi:hypothetical protein